MEYFGEQTKLISNAWSHHPVTHASSMLYKIQMFPSKTYAYTKMQIIA